MDEEVQLMNSCREHRCDRLAMIEPRHRASLSQITFDVSEAANTVQCFCTARDCKGPLCDGSWCLVGFKDDGKYQDLCTKPQEANVPLFTNAVDLIQSCATDSARPLVKCARKLNEWEEVCSCGTDFCNTFTYMRETLKKYDEFRLAHPNVPSEFDGFDTSNLEDKDARQGEQKTSPNKHLILLLVVVPLGIGAVTVCLVFLNYHCKMC